jgi:hypothetical protein
MKKFWGWVVHNSTIIITYAVLLSGVFTLYQYKQTSLMPGLNVYEAQVVSRVDTYQYPWVQPINAPYITATKLLTKILPISSLRAARMVNVVLMTASVVMFFWLLRNWLLSPAKALVGTTLFATSTWTLTLAHGAHYPVTGIFLTLLIFTLATRLFFTTRPFFDWITVTLASSLALYTPLMPWIALVGAVVAITHIRSRQRLVPTKRWQKAVIGVVLLLALSPLAIALIKNPAAVKELIGLSISPGSITTIGLNIVETVGAIFIRSESAHVLGLGRLPMLDIFSLFMFIMGARYFSKHRKLKRTKMLFGGLVFGIVVSSLGGFDSMHFSIVLPLLYIFIAAGIHEVVTRWLAVFPRNPIARGVGIAIVAIAIGYTTYYHLTRTFIARPGNPQMRSFYAKINS